MTDDKKQKDPPPHFMDPNGKIHNNISDFLDKTMESIRKIKGPNGEPFRSESG